jgi:proteic killer suppression protein
VIRSFADKGTKDVYDGTDSRHARRTCPPNLWAVAQRKLTMLRRVTRRDDLRFPPGNRLERLKGDRAGQDSIRINDQYRICFVWKDEGVEQVEIVDYHD